MKKILLISLALITLKSCVIENCPDPVIGCTDPEAINYNIEANVDIPRNCCMNHLWTACEPPVDHFWTTADVNRGVRVAWSSRLMSSDSHESRTHTECDLHAKNARTGIFHVPDKGPGPEIPRDDDCKAQATSSYRDRFLRWAGSVTGSESSFSDSKWPFINSTSK